MPEQTELAQMSLFEELQGVSRSLEVLKGVFNTFFFINSWYHFREVKLSEELSCVGHYRKKKPAESPELFLVEILHDLLIKEMTRNNFAS